MTKSYRVAGSPRGAIGGKLRVSGELVTHDEIMGREPWRLGSLLRQGVLIPEKKPAKAAKKPRAKKES